MRASSFCEVYRPMTKRRFHRSIYCLVMLLSCVSPITAQQGGNSNADWQSWPEVTLSIKLSERAAIVYNGTLHFGNDVSDLNEEQLGIGFNFSLSKYFSLNSAYRHISGQPPGRSHSQEHRFFLDFT